MEDKRWTTKDKIEQLRGINTIYNTTSANTNNKAAFLRKKQSKDIRNLTVQNEKYHQQYNDIVHGDKKNILPVFHSHPKLQLAFKNLDPSNIEEELKQLIFCKTKELDRLRYKRKNVEDTFLKQKLEIAELKNQSDETAENYLWEQEIANQIQSISVKLNAARSNRSVYENAVNILQKDAIRFDEVLNGLRKDVVHQCESIIKSIEMGQNVVNDLNELQKEYKVTEKKVRRNMKTRDRDIREMRVDLDNLRLHGYSLKGSRPELPPTNAVDDKLSEDDDREIQNLMNLRLKQEITLLETMLKKMMEAAKVSKVYDICSRITQMRHHKESLLKKVGENENQLTRMLQLRNQLDVMLEVVMHQAMNEDALNVHDQMVQLKKGISEEREYLDEAQHALLVTGKKVVAIRTALLTLNMTLDNVYPSPTLDRSTIDMSGQESVIVDSEDLDGKLKPLYQPNMDALFLMEMVTKKTKWLVERVDPSSEDLGVPTNMLRSGLMTILSKVSRMAAEDDSDNIVSDLLDELDDMDDPSVLTRKAIKAESQRLVDLFQNPQRMFLDSNEPKYKKHKCF